MVAENRAEFADDAGDVTVADIDQVALKRSFNVDAVHLQQTRSAPPQHSTLHQMLFARTLEENGNHTAGATSRGLLLVGFVYAKTARVGDGSRIHQIGLFLERLVQDALDSGI